MGAVIEDSGVGFKRNMGAALARVGRVLGVVCSGKSADLGMDLGR